MLIQLSSYCRSLFFQTLTHQALGSCCEREQTSNRQAGTRCGAVNWLNTLIHCFWLNFPDAKIFHSIGRARWDWRADSYRNKYANDPKHVLSCREWKVPVGIMIMTRQRCICFWNPIHSLCDLVSELILTSSGECYLEVCLLVGFYVPRIINRHN